MLVQYDRLRKRNAFLEQYKRETPFADGLGEFDDAKGVVMDLVAEYEEAEEVDYLSRESMGVNSGTGTGMAAGTSAGAAVGPGPGPGPGPAR